MERRTLLFDDVSRKACLNEEALLELCDAARAGLVEGSTTEAVAEKVTRFLRAAVKDENHGMATIELSTITNTRLDKLVADLQSPENLVGTTLPHLWRDCAASERLQRQWRARFREKYFDIDQTRYSNLSKQGLLRRVTFDDREGRNSELWRAIACEVLSGGQGNMQFEAGHYAVEKPTKGPYHVTALPLLSGREDLSSPVGTVKYAREGPLFHMHLSLLSQVGTQIRILRGYCLRSPLAPKAGIRYDGLYYIRQYSLKQNNQTGLHRVVLTLERVRGQRSLQDIAAIPRPSQLDDWQLFEKYEGEMIRQKRGDQGFLEWKTAKAEERINLEQWRRTLELRAELKSRHETSRARLKMGKNDKKGGDKAASKGKGSSDKEAGGGGKAKGAQSINVRHILCEKHAKKEEALAKLNEGVKFDEVARNYSEDKARQGGSLGWKSKGSLDPKFEEAAFALEPSTTSSPKFAEVKTGFGYHIIMVEGRK
ncbi:PPIC-type PPIASE domain-containing protein [Hirsutella rhossiliensis]|uniref:peptidylprolyl isomerase n=1 Tax=Hirsutella rhossiliensis TaxID=111463 RepID=A0A9P8SIS5_9HYPO|nr:PPIC-type PPIASE domain-containing protein [Hirsutella rhossiliensis]KAH0962930.1 PPIC-type PPIASE domain-containing protein [Hirsutella rhossiliensis]